MKNLALLIWLLLLLSTPLSNRLNEQWSAENKSDKKIPFKLRRNLIYLNAKVADTIDTQLVFDTGCPYLILDSLLYAQKIGLVDTLKKALISGIGDFHDTVRFCAEQMGYSIGSNKQKVGSYIVMNVNTLLNRRQIAGGLVGADFIGNRRVVIDYKNSVIEFLSRSKKHIGKRVGSGFLNADNGIMMPMIPLEIRVKGKITIKGNFLIDLGSSHGIILTAETAKAYNLKETVFHLNEQEVRGIGGVAKLKHFMADSLFVCDYKYGDVGVKYSTNEAGALSKAPFVGTVGNDFLKNFKVEIDFGQGIVWLQEEKFNTGISPNPYVASALSPTRAYYPPAQKF